MSKFLKFIVALILIVFIGAGAALIVPPFFGVDAIVVRGDTRSELSVGTAIYAKTMRISELVPGEKVLTQDTESIGIHEVTGFDQETGIAETAGGQSLQFNSAYKKVYFSVPFIGYLSIATQSQMGLIILLLVLALVVILFIISEILRRAKLREEEEEEDEADDDEFYSGLVERKRRRDESGERPGAYTFDKNEKLEPELPTPAAVADAETDEEAEFRDIFEDEAVVSLGESSREKKRKKEAEREKPADEQPRVVSVNANEDTALPDVQAALEAALENQQLGRTESIQVPPEAGQPAEAVSAPPEEVELAIPYHTADELIQQAYSLGKDPTIVKDDTTGITLVDYSDCI